MDPKVKAAIEQYKVREYVYALHLTEERILQDQVDALDAEQYLAYVEATDD